MKTESHQTVRLALFALGLLPLLPVPDLLVSTCCAQDTAFNYQGRLNIGGDPAQGIYDLRFTIYDALSGGNAVSATLTNSPTVVSNGLFGTSLDFGPGVFTGPARWVEIGVRTNGGGSFTVLSPRQPLAAVPYALFSQSAGSVPGLAVHQNSAGGPNVIAGSPINFVSSGVVAATIGGGGATNYGGTAYSNSVTADLGTVGGGVQNTAGGLSATVAGGQFNSARGSAATVSGGGANTASGASATVSGGWGNTSAAPAGTVGGGQNNTIGMAADNTTIGGGFGNGVGSNAFSATIAGGEANTNNAVRATLGGGWLNRIGQDSWEAVIAGGSINSISPNSPFASIHGGRENTIGTNASGSEVAGGHYNSIQANASDSAIGGGWANTNGGANSVVPGGFQNLAGGQFSFAAGQRAKALYQGDFVWADSQPTDFASTTADQFSVRAGGGVRLETGGAGLWVDGQSLAVAASGAFGLGTSSNQPVSLYVNGTPALRLLPDSGGLQEPSLVAGFQGNSISTNGAGASVIAGGGWSGGPNLIQDNDRGDFIGAGSANVILSNVNDAVIAGGYGNSVASSDAAIGGGYGNAVSTNAPSATIAGGNQNQAASINSTVGGGYLNRIGGNSWEAVIAGGSILSISSNAAFAAILGGRENSIGPGAYAATIGGGTLNGVGTNTTSAVIAGGRANLVLADYAAVLGGQTQTNAGPGGLIGGGAGNTITTLGVDGVIAGGGGNHVGGRGATVPGGYANSADGDTSLAAGFRAKASHAGAFVWADATDADFASTAANQFSVRATGGVRFETGGAGLQANGPVTATGFQGDGGGLTNLNAMTLGGAALATFWQTGGNGGTTVGDFLGTSDSKPLTLKVNKVTAVQILPGATLPNIVGGVASYRPSVVASGVSGAVIAGGNAPSGGVTGFGAGDFQAVYDNDGTVGGGFGNKVGTANGDVTDASFATVAGGVFNNAMAYGATIGGGDSNLAGGPRASVLGGFANQAWGAASTVGGGFLNVIQLNATDSIIGGGTSNLIQTGVANSFIGGGLQNTIQTYATYASISGGFLNVIQTNATASAIGGGNANTVESYAYESVIAGGGGNRVQAGASDSTIGGGGANLILTAAGESTIAGGYQNLIRSGVASTIGGGFQNNVWFGASATIAGGSANGVGDDLASKGSYASVGGGGQNLAVGDYSVIPGGNLNRASGAYSFAAGRRAVAVDDGSFVWGDSTDADFGYPGANKFQVRSSGGALFYANPAGTIGVYLAPGGNSWAPTSDRQAKENFREIDPQEILAKLVALPVLDYNLRSQDNSIRHLGPMAQDFAAAFHLGEDDKHITTVDADGVALAAIQGLNQKLEDRLARQTAELRSRDAQLAAQQQLINNLLGRVEVLEGRLNRATPDESN